MALAARLSVSDLALPLGSLAVRAANHFHAHIPPPYSSHLSPLPLPDSWILTWRAQFDYYRFGYIHYGAIKATSEKGR